MLENNKLEGKSAVAWRGMALLWCDSGSFQKRILQVGWEKKILLALTFNCSTQLWALATMFAISL